MCGFDILHHDDFGYVAHCRDCRRLQVAFGTVVFSFAPEECFAFASMIRAQAEKSPGCRDCQLKNIHLRTPAHNLLLALSHRELHQVNDLLQQSLLLLEVKTWL